MSDSDYSDVQGKSRSPVRIVSESSRSNFSTSHRKKNEHIYKQKLKEIDLRSDNDSDSDFRSRKKPPKKSGKKRARIMSDSEEDKEVYCVCRTSDVDRFMIACDNCQEWFHGDCVSITQVFSKKIINYYCVECRRSNSMLRIQLKPQFVKKSPDESDEEAPTSPPRPPPSVKTKPIKKDIKSESEFEIDSDDENFNKKKKKKEKEKEKTPQKRKYQRKQAKTKVKVEKPKKDTAKASRQKANKKTTEKAERKTTKTNSKKNKNRTLSEDGSADEAPTMKSSNSPRQCYGPSCVQHARKGSKYCSDECGISLATKRIKQFVPERLKEWQQLPCAADELSRKELEIIRKEQTHAAEILQDIERKQLELDELIERGKSSIPYTEDECIDIIDEEFETDVAINCPTCSLEVNLKQALKHMEKCFNKVESRTSFCSAMKTKIENQRVFCDQFNPLNGTYCKRLKVLCPEHSKENRIADDEVCGCPLRTEKDPFTDSTESYCRMLRKKCVTHYGWEKFRQASLDAQKIQQWLKLDELYEREQKVMHSLNSRHGLVQLLLHRTIIHS